VLAEGARRLKETTVNDDDFFESIGKKTADLKKQQEAKHQKAEQNREFAGVVVAEIAPIADEYKARLEEKGVNAKVKKYERSLTFELRYQDGDSQALQLACDLETGRMELTKHFTERGNSYFAAPTSSYDESNWSNDLFVAELKKVVSDFMDYAERHGGVA
jgi:hypothetical protein